MASSGDDPGADEPAIDEPGGPRAGSSNGPGAAPPGVIRYVCFRLRGQEYAADIANVKETMMVLPITRVFLTPPWLSGIINLRGDIVAVIDLARFMDLPPTASHVASHPRPGASLPSGRVDDHARIVICRHRGKVAGLVVDEMADLRTIDSESIQPPPPTLTGESAALLAGVVTVDDDAPLRVLDLSKLFDSERLRAFQRPDSPSGREENR